MKSRWLAGLIGLLTFSAAVAIAACGGDDDESASGNETDRAFVAGMVPHHQSAIEMAKVAKERGQSEFVDQLADDIIASQGEEIAVMKRVDAQLAKEGVEVGNLGVPGHLTGMEDDMAALESARPFDREFIDMMIAHHAGAIRQARVETEEGDNAQLVELAHDDFVFSSAVGGPLNQDNVRNRVLKPVAEEAGVPWVGFHTFRRTCGSLLFARGANAVQVQRWLGHHSAAFTLATYIHLLPNELGDALSLSKELGEADDYTREERALIATSIATSIAT